MRCEVECLRTSITNAYPEAHRETYVPVFLSPPHLPRYGRRELKLDAISSVHSISVVPGSPEKVIINAGIADVPTTVQLKYRAMRPDNCEDEDDEVGDEAISAPPKTKSVSRIAKKFQTYLS